MKYPTRRFITEPEGQMIFDRWFKGESQYSIAHSLGRGRTSIQGVLSRTGGIRPLPRKRSRRALSLAEREEAWQLIYQTFEGPLLAVTGPSEYGVSRGLNGCSG